MGLAGSIQKPVAKIDDRPGDRARNTRRKQAYAKDGKQQQCGGATIIIGVDRPAAPYCGKCRHKRNRDGHACQHWQGAANEGLPGSGKDEGKDGEDAGAEDSQRSSEIGNNKKCHNRYLENRNLGIWTSMLGTASNSAKLIKATYPLCFRDHGKVYRSVEIARHETAWRGLRTGNRIVSKCIQATGCYICIQ